MTDQELLDYVERLWNVIGVEVDDTHVDVIEALFSCENVCPQAVDILREFEAKVLQEPISRLTREQEVKRQKEFYGIKE